MSSDDAHSSEHEELSKRVDAIQIEVATVHTAIRRGRTTRRLLFLAFLTFIVVYSAILVRKVKQLQSPESLDRYVAVAQMRFEQSSDRYLREVETLVDFAAPKLTKAFYEQTKKDMPKYTDALERERDQLLESLETELQAQVNRHYQQAVKRHESILTSEFPQFGDKKQTALMIANMQVALEQLLERHYGQQLRTELLQMFETWDSFPVAKSPRSGEPPLEDQLVDSLLRLATLRLAESRSIEVAEAPGTPTADVPETPTGDGTNE